MSFPNTGTKLANLLDPAVYADMVKGELANKIVFAPVCDIDYTLEGVPGSTVTVPVWQMIAEAGVLTEGNDITVSQMTKTTDTATIKQLACGVQLTDKAALCGYGDPVGESARQVAESLNGALDTEVYNILHAIASSGDYYYTTAAATLTADDINNALVKFGEKIDGVKYLFCSPADYAILRKASAWLPASEIAAERMVSGVVGQIYGCDVIITNKCTTSSELYIVKEHAFRTFMKREANIEFDRDIINKSTIITGDILAVQYLYDKSGAIRIVKAAG